jgi:hypothetical protein
MCDLCELQFNMVAERFSDYLARCRNIPTQPRRSPPTTAERVHDRAVEFAAGGESALGNWINSWYLAMAVERLLALEDSGIPT